MQHGDAMRAMASEKYLLNELTPELREEFEEHFFGCPECALDVRAGAAFLEHSKVVLAEPAPRPVAVAAQSQPENWWSVWLRPTLVVPVMALLLMMIGYQSLTLSKSKNAIASAQAPRILASASLVSARGDKIPVVTVRANDPFLLFVDIPSESRFTSYLCELRSPAGQLEWSIPVSAETAKNTLPLQVPAGQRAAGVYTLVVQGVAAGGNNSVLARYSFELQSAN